MLSYPSAISLSTRSSADMTALHHVFQQVARGRIRPFHTSPSPRSTHARQGYCVVGSLLVTASMRSLGRRLARLVARAMLGSPLLRWYPMAVFRRTAATAGPLPVRT